MKMGKMLASVAMATSLVAAPVAAQAAAAARAGTPVADAENMRGGFLIPAIAIVAILLGILAATSGGDDAPHSP